MAPDKKTGTPLDIGPKRDKRGCSKKEGRVEKVLESLNNTIRLIRGSRVGRGRRKTGPIIILSPRSGC